MSKNLAPRTPCSYCYNELKKESLHRAMKRFYRRVGKALDPHFSVKLHFNPGGIAVWGEVYMKISVGGRPVVESYNTSMGILVRQWDGNNSGRNVYVSSLEELVSQINALAAAPFKRF